MKVVFSLLMLLAATWTHAQVSKLDKIFDTYQEAKGVTSIKIGKPMFNMINKLNIGDSEMEQIKPLLTKINSIKMLIVEEDQDFQIQKEVKNAFAKINYEELMAIHSDGSRIKFLAEHTDDKVLNNLLLDITADGSTIFMILDGLISFDDINKLVEEK
ncbi:uncharacterized protein DUF4252 [Sphingobacterium allocomposti]|uniref:Uncharacterized protein DUF4252 n=1 Tax=Sphingobacterium allocomposti TaxID=415956 RepID=A0A5S5DRD8_9SPHI|nr:DUF4252 domain-containing protein [Sphingobacterium composti Yoo et al. 2007 non Ten et al. 2007]TYP97586.1 uncharacterized protein DUF4252 [Sphingobacterium composti Yoo et al. 2007 non Ten et al. 2007]